MNPDFHAVNALGVLGYQVDQLAFLQHMARGVIPRGVLAFTSGNGDSLWRRLRKAMQQGKLFLSGKQPLCFFTDSSLAAIDKTLAKAGLRREYLHYLTVGLGAFPCRLEVKLSRWLEKRLSRTALGKYLALTGMVLYRRG